MVSFEELDADTLRCTDIIYTPECFEEHTKALAATKSIAWPAAGVLICGDLARTRLHSLLFHDQVEYAISTTRGYDHIVCSVPPNWLSLSLPGPDPWDTPYEEGEFPLVHVFSKASQCSALVMSLVARAYEERKWYRFGTPSLLVTALTTTEGTIVFDCGD